MNLTSSLISVSFNIIYLEIYNILLLKDCYPIYNNNDFYIEISLGEQIKTINFIQYNIFHISIKSKFSKIINFTCNLYGPTLLKDSNIKCFLNNEVPSNTELSFFLKKEHFQKSFQIEIDKTIKLFSIVNIERIFPSKIISNCDSINKIAICYITNNKNFNEVIFKIYYKLVSYLNKNKFDVYILLSNEINNNTINKKWEKITHNLIIFKYYKLKNYLNYSHTFDKDEYVGNCHLPIIYFSKIHPEYIGYFFYEDDVYINFKQNLFDMINFDNFDVILQNKRKINDKEWSWLKKHLHSDFGNLTISNSGLYNIYYIKKKVLNQFYNWFMENYFYGHHELLYNTFFYLKKNEYNIEYFDNYVNDYTDSYNPKSLLLKTILNEKIHIIFHPCKNEQYYQLLECFNHIFDK